MSSGCSGGELTDAGGQNQSIGVHQRDVDFAVRRTHGPVVNAGPEHRWDWRSNCLNGGHHHDKTLNGT